MMSSLDKTTTTLFLAGKVTDHPSIKVNYHLNLLEMEGSDGSTVVLSDSSGGSSSSLTEGHCETPQNQVFHEQSLLTRIISCALVDSKTGRISRRDLVSFRLVQKRWMEAITTYLLKSQQEPLFQLTLTKINSLWGSSYVQKNGKLLDQFVGKMKASKTIPPFSLKLQPDFMRKENHQSLLNCLTSSCGSSLVSLHITFPKNPSMIFNFPPFTLPNLKTLSIYFSSEKIMDLGNMRFSLNGSSCSSSLFLIQAILSSAQNLKTFLISGSTFEYTELPPGFETLRVPQTLWKIEITCPPASVTDWKFLQRNRLPQLTHLTLSVGMKTSSRDDEGREVLRIIQNLRHSLQSLELVGYQKQLNFACCYPRFPMQPVVLRFPVMKSLSRLKVTGPRWSVLDVQGSLPKLDTLLIPDQQDDMFRKWTDFGYPSVKTLLVSVISDDKHPVTIPFTVERMQCLHFAFHNLSDLRITLSGDGEAVSDALKYLFSSMISLERLSITVNGSRDKVTCDDWDGLLIGAPKEMAKALRQSPEYWSNFSLKDCDGRFPSLRNLTKLTSLCLNDELNGDTASPLLSDVAFHFGFFRTPALKTLQLTGQFKASDEMKRKWTKKMKGASVIHNNLLEED